MSQSLPVKYRPTKLEDVVGHVLTIKSLQRALVKPTSRVFLFHGPSGTGKTTLARIVANEFGCSSDYILEVDAATNNGVDNVRDIQETLRYKPMGKNAMRAIILDEAHMLSKAAWNSLLKPLEDVPSHVVWFLCTTELDKVPATIKTRCSVYGLSSVSVEALKRVVNRVAKAEGMKLKEDVVDIIAREARGSPRQALTFLDMCSEVKTKSEALKLLKSAIESDPVRKLCQMLVDGRGSWKAAMVLVGDIKNEQPEGVRIVVCNYVAAVLKKCTSDKEATRLLSILEAFEGTYNQSEKQAPLLLSIGRVLFQ